MVLPCVPATATADFSRISSASISARRTTGRPRARAATSSGLSRLMAEETTTTAGSAEVLRRRGRSQTAMPVSRSRCTLALSATSEPCTR